MGLTTDQKTKLLDPLIDFNKLCTDIGNYDDVIFYLLENTEHDIIERNLDYLVANVDYTKHTNDHHLIVSNEKLLRGLVAKGKYQLNVCCWTNNCLSFPSANFLLESKIFPVYSNNKNRDDHIVRLFSEPTCHLNIMDIVTNWKQVKGGMYTADRFKVLVAKGWTFANGCFINYSGQHTLIYKKNKPLQDKECITYLLSLDLTPNDDYIFNSLSNGTFEVLSMFIDIDNLNHSNIHHRLNRRNLSVISDAGFKIKACCLENACHLKSQFSKDCPDFSFIEQILEYKIRPTDQCIKNIVNASINVNEVKRFIDLLVSYCYHLHHDIVLWLAKRNKRIKIVDLEKYNVFMTPELNKFYPDILVSPLYFEYQKDFKVASLSKIKEIINDGFPVDEDCLKLCIHRPDIVAYILNNCNFFISQDTLKLYKDPMVQFLLKTDRIKKT